MPQGSGPGLPVVLFLCWVVVSIDSEMLRHPAASQAWCTLCLMQFALCAAGPGVDPRPAVCELPVSESRSCCQCRPR